MAGEEELTHENVHTEVLNAVALRHPSVFDVFKLYDMPADSGKLRQLSLAMLLSICELNILIFTWKTSKDDGKLPTCPYLESFSSHAIVTTVPAYDWPSLLL